MLQPNSRMGISDSWSWFGYIAGSICKYRVYTSRTDSNLIMKVNEITGKAKVQVLI